MSFVDEIIESFKTHPEKWSWDTAVYNYGYWYCTKCTDLAQFEQEFKLGKKVGDKWCKSCQTWYTDHIHVLPKHSILKHESGIMLRNPNPVDDKNWLVIEPELTYMSWWDRRKLRKAIPALRKAQMKLKLFGFEI